MRLDVLTQGVNLCVPVKACKNPPCYAVVHATFASQKVSFYSIRIRARLPFLIHNK
jgi:hypothetical protein